MASSLERRLLDTSRSPQGCKGSFLSSRGSKRVRVKYSPALSRNISPDIRRLFQSDAKPINKCREAEDERRRGRDEH